MDKQQVEMLEGLASLKERGILTEEEFQRKKSELLAPRREASPPVYAEAPAPVKREGTLWLPIPSLILGIMCVLAFADDSGWDEDTIIGLVMFALTSIVLGIVSVSRQKEGKGAAITGIVLSALALLALAGM